MSKNSGNPFKRGSTWTYVYYIIDSETGDRKQKWRGGFKTQKEASEDMVKTKAAILNDTYTNDSKIAIKQYLDRWCQTNRESLAPNSILSYKYCIENHVIPSLGKIRLSELTKERLTSFYSKLEKDGLSPSTIKYINSILHKAFNDAIADQLISKNPCNNAKRPKIKKYKSTVLNINQIQTILQKCIGTNCETELIIALTTGMRRGEVLGLRFSDFDFENSTVHVQQQVTTVFDESDKRIWGVKSLKTEESDRIIYVPPIVIESVKGRRIKINQQKLLLGSKYNDLNLVCCADNGQCLSPNILCWQFKKLLKELNLPNIRFHDLRHSCATALLDLDVPLKVISQMLGHSSITITADVYCDVIEKKKQPANVMQNIYKFGTSGSV